MAVMRPEEIEPFGRLRSEVAKNYDGYLDIMVEHFNFLDEILDQVKQSCQNPGIELLPKTPSEKRKRGRVKRGSIKKRDSSSMKLRSSTSSVGRKSPAFQKVKACILSLANESSATSPSCSSTAKPLEDIALVPTFQLDVVKETGVDEDDGHASAMENDAQGPDNGICHYTDDVRAENEENKVPKEAVDEEMQSPTKENCSDRINEPRVSEKAECAGERGYSGEMALEETLSLEPKRDSPEDLAFDQQKEKPVDFRTPEPLARTPEDLAYGRQKEKPTYFRTPEPVALEPEVHPLIAQSKPALTVTTSGVKSKLPTPVHTPRLTPTSQHIKRYTPQKSGPKLSNTQMGERLKQQLEEAAVKREELLKLKIEENKRKREERQLKVARMRLLQKAKDEELKRKIEEKYLTPIGLDTEEKRWLRPRFPNSAAKPQETIQKQLLEREKEKEKERIQREQDELRRLEREKQQQKQLHAGGTSVTQNHSKANYGKTVHTSNQVSRAFEEPKDASLAKVVVPKPNRGTFNVSVASVSANQSGLSETYDMTPLRELKPSTSTNYDISDLRSSDETDDEEHPRKKIPHWAQGGQLKMALTQQYYNSPDLDDLFGVVQMPDLSTMFTYQRKRFQKRTSSAKWDSPIHPHAP